MASSPSSSLPSSLKLRIAFIHPDLGIGGAERLVVDAALGLQKRGHAVHIFTSSHHPNRCFAETADGTIPVCVLGNSIFPRAFRNRFITILAVLRQFHLSFSLLVSFATPNRLSRSARLPFDVYFIDQLSAAIPLLRYASRTRVLFYCHFPDLLLSPTKPSDQKKLLYRLKSLYRIPLDWLEEYTTGQADTILVNSNFTAEVFKQTLKTIAQPPRCVYPGVNIDLYDRKVQENTSEHIPPPISSTRPTILSINRFEEKKDLKLLLVAFILLWKRLSTDCPPEKQPRLVLAGGYDERLIDNQRTLNALRDLILHDGTLTHATLTGPQSLDNESPDVLFLPNVSEANKLALLRGPSTQLLAYTASNEHLGIGPLEAMACRLPVLATDSGGPKETVSDSTTGFLVPPDPAAWADALERILAMPSEEREAMGAAGRERVSRLFSTDVMVAQIEQAVLDVVRAAGKPDVWQEPSLFKALTLVCFPILSIWIALWMAWANY